MWSQKKVDSQASRRLLRSCKTLSDDTLLQEMRHVRGNGLTLPLELLKRVLFHAWNDQEGATEAHLLGQLFAHLFQRGLFEAHWLETPAFNAWGLVAVRLSEHFPGRQPLLSLAPTLIGKSRPLGFQMIFAPCEDPREQRYRSTDPSRLLSLLQELDHWGVVLPSQVRWTDAQGQVHCQAPTPQDFEAFLSVQGRTAIAPVLALARQTGLNRTLASCQSPCVSRRL